MRPCWRHRGMTEMGAALADKTLPAVLALVEQVGSEVVQVALYEASFRLKDLPERTPEYRARYLKENE